MSLLHVAASFEETRSRDNDFRHQSGGVVCGGAGSSVDVMLSSCMAEGRTKYSILTRFAMMLTPNLPEMVFHDKPGAVDRE